MLTRERLNRMIKRTLITEIQKALGISDKVYWKDHALARMRQRNIRVDDIVETLFSGEIIEEYRTDRPFPSVLVNGRTAAGRSLHVVVGVHAQAGEIHIITGYEPDPQRWNENFSKRK